MSSLLGTHVPMKLQCLMTPFHSLHLTHMGGYLSATYNRRRAPHQHLRTRLRNSPAPGCFSFLSHTRAADFTRFPSGMKALGDYVHSKGLTFAIYSAESTETCGGYPASKDYEALDAQTFASWGVDYIKVRAWDLGYLSTCSDCDDQLCSAMRRPPRPELHGLTDRSFLSASGDVAG